MEKRINEAERFAKIWWKSRTDSGLSQEYMAMGLGVSTKTIQNWEKGISSPSLFKSIEWFKILGQNPMKYYREFLYPELFEDLSPQNEDEKIEQSLNYIIDGMTPLEKRQLLFVITSHHGSSWYSLLQMFTAHCHTSLKSRIGVASLIARNYELEEETDQLVCEENVRPNMELLKSSIESATTAVKKGQTGYSSADHHL